MPRVLVVDNYDSFVYTIVGYLEQLGAECRVVRNDAVEASAASTHDGVLVSPGPGTPEDAGISTAIIEECARTRTPMFGVCLGLQMLFETTEEGPTRGLGVFAGRVEKFREEAMVLAAGERLKVPHMGWSPVRQTRAHPLWAGIDDGARFYFAHSYYPVPAEAALTAATAAYPAPFTCAIARANIFAVQFHPEKSQRAGLRLLANFVGWDGSS